MVKNGVIGFGRARGPNDIQGRTAQQSAQTLARRGQRGVGARPQAVGAGGIAEEVLRLQPGLAGLGEQRRGRIVVKIDHLGNGPDRT